VLFVDVLGGLGGEAHSSVCCSVFSELLMGGYMQADMERLGYWKLGGRN
jgi:hypothetical protein